MNIPRSTSYEVEYIAKLSSAANIMIIGSRPPTPPQSIAATLPSSVDNTTSTINQPNFKVHQDTPAKMLGGNYRREASKIWKELAQSEARVNLIRILVSRVYCQAQLSR